MPNYSFSETLSFFAFKLDSPLPIKTLENEEVELTLDNLIITLSPAKSLGSLSLSISLGLLLHPVPELRLKELMASHFLGVNTGGCSICLDEAGVTLYLKNTTSPFTTPQENWEWLHRIVAIAYEWVKALSLWEEFVPLLHLPPPQETQKGTRL